jgi:ribonuclease Z
MKFTVTILGSGAAKPTGERLSSAHVLNVHEHFFLIDCGEGAQISMMKHGIPIQKIDHIFISHLHGDHYFGLIGLLNTMHLLSRKNELHLYCFPELEKIISLQLTTSETQLTFKLKFHFLNNKKSEMIMENKYVSVISFPLKHRIPTCGFRFTEKKRSRNIKREFVLQHKIPVEWFPRILSGEDFIDEHGFIHKNEDIVRIQSVSRSYAYCSDTAFDETIIPAVKDVSMLYHEASFSDEHESVASQKFHSTSRQAAMIAMKANAGTLIIGHFSARYKNAGILTSQAKEIFENTIEAFDGLTVEVDS